MDNYIPSEIEGLIAATSSRAEAMDYVSKHKGSKYKSVKSI